MEQIKLKNIIVFLGILCFNITLNAQSISPFCISSMGNNVTKNKISYSHTMGQLISSSAYNKGILTQGYEQPINQSTEKIIFNQEIKQTIESQIYPNPVIDIVNISIDVDNADERIYLEVFNIYGQLIFTEQKNPKSDAAIHFTLNFNHLKAGIYYLKAYTATKEIELSSFKIIKQ